MGSAIVNPASIFVIDSTIYVDASHRGDMFFMEREELIGNF
ncbi:hypothetical protein NVR49_21150 [Enterobacter roggenkampii]|nr:hypothetical protein [Enterobacter roggenkampii]MDL0009094.1 hypothetical protein [Enterobacter roggenkampii]